MLVCPAPETGVEAQVLQSHGKTCRAPAAQIANDPDSTTEGQYSHSTLHELTGHAPPLNAHQSSGGGRQTSTAEGHNKLL